MSHFIEKCRNFKNGITDANDINRTGQSSASKTDVNEDLVMNWFFKTFTVIQDLSTLLGLSLGTVQSTDHKELVYPKLCLSLVPKCLAEDKEHPSLISVLVLNLAVHALTTKL